MKKEYTFNSVTYGFSLGCRKWVFKSQKFAFVTSVKGGKENADKISHLVNAGLIRTKGLGLDGLARANIAKLTA
jgi:hypothetical protein